MRLAVSALAGMAVGVEREWSGHATGPQARFAGVRTFFLLGAIGGVAGWLLDSEAPLVAAALLLATGGLIVGAYLTAAHRGAAAIDGTTETAAVLVLGVGLLAGMGFLRIASGAAAVIVLVLGEKDVIRKFVSRIGREEMQAALQFAVLALVVLPLLPAGPIERLGGMKPRELWAVVLLFSGLNFAGYIARRILGDTRGYQAMGALGGLVSSTLVTLTFARQSRREPDNAIALAVGTVAACTILIPRILVITLILNPALFPRTALGLLPTLIAGILLIMLGWRHLRDGAPKETPPAPRNPLQLRTAILMAVGFQAVLFLLDVVTQRFGESGVLASAAVLGLTDMDALTFGMNRLAQAPELVSIAALAIVLGVTVNGAF
ncbi:MAG TPA: MgtC/SapB family protein, partial [Gemmatimonadales bacterium]